MESTKRCSTICFRTLSCCDAVNFVTVQVGAVLVGYDNYFSFMKLTKACSYLKNPNCLFIATNEDSCLPINSDTIVIPGDIIIEAVCWLYII